MYMILYKKISQSFCLTLRWVGILGKKSCMYECDQKRQWHGVRTFQNGHHVMFCFATLMVVMMLMQTADNSWHH